MRKACVMSKESRPCGAALIEVVGATQPSINRDADSAPDLWQLLAGLREHEYYAASLGYRVGVLDGAESVQRAIGDAGAAVAAAARDLMRRPRYTTAAKRRAAADCPSLCARADCKPCQRWLAAERQMRRTMRGLGPSLCPCLAPPGEPHGPACTDARWPTW